MIRGVAGYSCLAVLMILFMLAWSVRVQGADEGSAGQAAPQEEKSRPKEFKKVFCPNSSAAQRNMMVNATNCNDVCDNAHQDYPCELQARLAEGWQVTSVSVMTITVQRDPCECGLTGTESVLERQQK